MNSAAHPYTRALLASLPIGQFAKEHNFLYEIPGVFTGNYFDHNGCIFFDRCCYAKDECKINPILLKKINIMHDVKCLFPLFIRGN